MHTPISCRLNRLSSLRLRVPLVELDAHRVNAVPLVGRRGVSLALEDVPQVSTAVAANNLRSLHAESAVGMPCHSAGDGVEERGPAAAGLELVLRGVNGLVAAGAVVCAGGRGVLVIFAGERGFGALLAEYAELL